MESKQSANVLNRAVAWFSTPPVSGHWAYRFILYPLLQMVVFVFAIALFLTLFAYGLAIIFPFPRENISLWDQISRQLPGMIIGGISIGFVYSMVALGYTL